MINHARTLLLNRSRDNLSGSWEEYVDPLFAKRPLPTYLDSMWRVLFGSNPDKEMLNWRASQYMQILHSTDFAMYLTALDSRISYKVPRVISDAEIPYTVVISANDNQPVTLLGTPRDDAFNGRLTQSFSVTRLIDDSLVVQNNFSDRLTTVAAALSSSPIILGQSGLSMLIDPAGDGGENKWLIESVTTPTRTLVDIMDDLKRLPAGHVDQIFGPSRYEPWLSFRKLWTNDRGFNYKMSGLLLAWIYRQEQLING